MQTYIGTKLIRATPMDRAAYNDYRGWELPDDEDGNDPGFLVEYLDGGRANDPRHAGYISWSPKDVFERAYRPTEELTFGLAVEALKSGKRVARAGWNGKGMWLELVNAKDYSVHGIPAVTEFGANGYFKRLPWIGMKTAGDEFVPWLASQTDVLADDYYIIEEPVADDWCIAECQGAKCGAIDGQDHSHECIVEAAETQGWSDAPEAIEAKLTVAVTAFIEEHGISCPETIYQTDRVIENAAQLIEKLADVVGYIPHKEPK